MIENSHDLEIKFLTRGDDIEMLNQAIIAVPSENEIVLGYLCYIKNKIIEQLDMDLPKEEYSIGHPKGFSEQEFLEYMEED